MYAINTNIRSQFSMAALSMIERKQNVAMQQLSTGKRINSAKDDAAGMAIAARMSDLIRGTNQAIKNANDGINLIQTAEGASQQVMDILQRMRELAVQAANATYTPDQRADMDVEYQQLKSTIVQIANKTQWNGMALLNGTAGTQGSLPSLYKTSSQPAYSPNYQGQSAVPAMLMGTVSASQLSAAPSGGFNVSGKMAVTLSGGVVQTATFTTDAGKTYALPKSITLSGGTYTVKVLATELKSAGLDFLASNDITLTTTNADASLSLTQPAVVTNDAFTQPGLLAVKTVYSGGVTSVSEASYTLRNGSKITITPSLLQVVGDTLRLSRSAVTDASLLRALTKDLVISTTQQAHLPTSMSLAMDVVQGSEAGALQSGDLVVNGIRIEPNGELYDTLSPTANAQASAISKASLINAYKEQTGVTAVVNTNTMPGAAMTLATRVLQGSIEINGYRTRVIQTSTDITDGTRNDVTAAINEITRLTGVKAIDTRSDANGIVLQAADGRNIEVRFFSSESDSSFSQAIGLRDGVQIGTYSLATHDKKGLQITADLDANPGHSGLSKGNYSPDRVTSVQVNTGLLATASTDVVTLQTGDLVINGIQIPASSALNDAVSNLTVETSSRYASAIAIAAAINSKSTETQVKALVNPVVIDGNVMTTNVTSGANLYINGELIAIASSDMPSTAADRKTKLITAINANTATGVVAYDNGSTGIGLRALDGRNVSVWSSVAPSELGLGHQAKNSSDITIPDGISTSSSAINYTKGATLYASLMLQSAQDMAIHPGSNGYGSTSHFSALGFVEQDYQAQSNVTGRYYDPPQIAKLSLQIGGQKGQSMDIYLPDFSDKGVLTQPVSWDESMTDSERTARLSSSSSASSSSSGASPYQQAFYDPAQLTNSFSYGLTQPPPVSSLKEATAARTAMGAIDDVIKNISQTQATMGAFINRLEKSVANLSSYYMNMSASRSAVEDTDYAQASSEMAKAQIMQQAATAVLAQANTNQQTVLKLLQN